MEILPIVYLLLVGAGAGFLAGLLGIGGGMIMVPFMSIYLDHKGFGADVVIKVAIATSLATILFTSASSVRAQHARGAVRWGLVRDMAPGIVLGSLIGAQFASSLPGGWLSLVFSVFIATLATRMLRQKRPNPDKTLPGRAGLLGAGAVMGGLSAVLGAGGAFITTPFLVKRNVSIHEAVGTSAACGFPVALVGTLGYIMSGWFLPMPGGTLGYVFLPGLFFVSIASIFTAPVGVRVAHSTSAGKLKRFFGFMLYTLAAYMLWRAWHFGL